MRLSKEKRAFLKRMVKQRLPNGKVFLFGSRTNDQAKGGDIDVLVIGERRLRLSEKIDLKVSFYKAFGQQKIDIVSYRETEASTFKDLILSTALPL